MKKVLHPEDFSLTKDARHRKVIDLLDHQGLKPLKGPKDNPDFAVLNWLSHFRLTNAIKAFGRHNHVSHQGCRKYFLARNQIIWM